MQEVPLKAAAIPAVRISPELRKAAEAVLESGEALSGFVEYAVRRNVEFRYAQKAFIGRGLASRDAARKSGKYVPAATVARSCASSSFPSVQQASIIQLTRTGSREPEPVGPGGCMLDGLDGNATHAAQRINLAVVAKSPIARIREFARGRGWRNLRLLSSAANSYNRDYRGETADGKQFPSLNVFVKRGDKIHHVYNTELAFAPRTKGQDPRHVDAIWPLWNLFDFTPEGRGADWYPKLEYAG